MRTLQWPPFQTLRSTHEPDRIGTAPDLRARPVRRERYMEQGTNQVAEVPDEDRTETDRERREANLTSTVRGPAAAPRLPGNRGVG